jgi:hypothetical protein
LSAQVLNHEKEIFRMYYSTAGADGKFSIALATSRDGVAWSKEGVVLGPGGPGAFDERGVTRRHVFRSHEGSGYDMLYEGVDAKGRHAIGWARSTDGVQWEVGGGAPA